MSAISRYTGFLWALLGLPASTVVAQGHSCAPLDSTAAWARVNRAWSNEAGLHWTNDSLRRVLLDLADRDQAARVSFGAHATDTAYGRRLIALDSTLADSMRRILARFGLPTRAMVGARGSDAAMLIVQHNADLQAPVLAMARAAPAGQVSPQALAMLEDRLLVHAGKPQRYGTQFTMVADGQFRFAPTAAIEGLETRRAHAGLPPFEQYVCLMEEAGMRIERGSLPRLRRPAAPNTMPTRLGGGPTLAAGGSLSLGLGPTTIAANQESSGSLADRLRLDAPQESHRLRHALIGGVIGGATGIVVCTVISNIVKDSGTGFSTCTTSGYLGFGLGGFGVGALIGVLIK